MTPKVRNHIDGEWLESNGTQFFPVHNPATAELLAETPLSPASEVDQAAQAASAAFESWRHVPATQRIQYLFKLKDLMEEKLDAIARTITKENGNVYGESVGDASRH